MMMMTIMMFVILGTVQSASREFTQCNQNNEEADIISITTVQKVKFIWDTAPPQGHTALTQQSSDIRTYFKLLTHNNVMVLAQ